MALRSFRGPDGALWNVWNVDGASVPRSYSVPRVRERRGQDLLSYRGPERRKAERRTVPSGRSLLRGDYAAGWLVFESDGAKRRLAPPPAGWEGAEEEALVELWRRAQVVTSRGVEAS
jgi:hypothetical protein